MSAAANLPLVGALNGTERNVLAGLAVFFGLLFVSMLAGVIEPAYLFFLLSLAGMYVLLTMGLNVQWGYAGLINFSVAAFWGIGAYCAALVTATNSPLGLELHPVFGLVAAVAVSALVAVLIGIPTLRLREDYLAIATLGLAEVVRLLILNEEQWTNGSAGVSGIPRLFEGVWLDPVLRNFFVVVGLIALVYLFLRRVHQSPWGRVLRTIRADEDLAEALGKDTYAFKMQAFVLGSVIMAVAGVFYVHLNLYLGPDDLEPIQTFYIWIAVILGGTGSNRGAMIGGLTVVAILEGTRFLNTAVIPAGVDVAPLRLLFVGLLIILVIRYREEGLLPPQHELIAGGVASEKGGGPDE